MSISGEITRIQNNVSDTLAAIEAKGVTVASDATSDDMAAYVAAIETNGYTVPDYWQDEIDDTVTKVKALQDAGGSEVVNFCWFSDLHYVPASAYTANVGDLCAALMDECDIPFTLFTGDTTAADVFANENILLEYMRAAADMLSPIGSENLLQIRGNHDDVYGSYTSGSTTTSYVNKVSSKKIWNAMHREGAKDFRRHYGGNGTYWYIDNEPQKVRFVCLNSHYYDGDGWTGGTSGAMTGGFGTEQLEWLENTALSIEDGWSVVIATHVPPTAKTVNGSTYYLSQLPDGVDFREIVENATADIIGIFCGHCHADAIVMNDLPCPIMTITSAVNTPYDADKSTRVSGTATETALDVVSINKATKTIYCTRLGYGADRSANYGKSYTITQNLTYVTSSNAAASVEEGSAFAATLTASDGYELSTVTVTMGGADITASAYSNGAVSIAEVTGNVVITAVAVKAAAKYTNLFDPSKATLNVRLSSSGTPQWNGMFLSDFIPVSGLTRNSDIFYIANAYQDGTGIDAAMGNQYIGYYNSSKTLLNREAFADENTGNNFIEIHDMTNGVDYVYPLTSTSLGAAVTQEDVAYVRFGLATSKQGGTATAGTTITVNDIQNVIITLNEPIE